MVNSCNISIWMLTPTTRDDNMIAMIGFWHTHSADGGWDR